MNYQDHLTLEEAYSKVVTKELLTEDVQEEGLWDRVKGAAAGVGKVARNFSDTAQSNTKFTGKGGYFDEVGKQFKGGRASSVIQSHISKLNAEIDDFIDDVKKVNIGNEAKKTDNEITSESNDIVSTTIDSKKE